MSKVRLIGFLAALAALHAGAACQRMTHGASVTVVDDATGARLAGAVVALMPLRLTQVTDELGHVCWNTGSEPNYIVRGRKFGLGGSAPGYSIVTAVFDALPSTACDDACLVSYCLRLKASALRAAPPPTLPASGPPAAAGFWSYEFVRYSTTDCNDCPAVHCIDVVDGKPVGKLDYSGKNSKKQSSKCSFGFKFGDKDKGLLLGLGFDLKDDSEATKEETLDMVLGDKDFPGKCGRICIRRQELRFRYNRFWNEHGVKTNCGVSIYDVQVGWCLGAELEDCETKQAKEMLKSGARERR